MFTWQNTAWEFKETPPQVAILPLACLEPHGAHLPIGTDQLIVSEIARRVAEILPFQTFLLPTWPLGMSFQHDGQAGAISLRYDTLWAVVRDIILSLCDHNIRFVAVINNHGSIAVPNAYPVGNSIVKPAVRQLNYETPTLSAIWVQPFTVARETLKALFSSPDQEVHAGALETSILMNLEPILVGTLPQDYTTMSSFSWLGFLDSHTIFPGGVWGKPSEATAEKGQLALDAIVRATSEYIGQCFCSLGK
jgi:creatinine amidohydrolase